MRKGIGIVVTASDETRLEGIVAARGSPKKHVWQAWIVLLSNDGLGTVAIMAATGKSKTCVWRWQERFMAEGVDGLLRDKTRPPGTAPLKTTVVDKVVALTLEPADHEATHWTVRAMAKAVGIRCNPVIRPFYKHLREQGKPPKVAIVAAMRKLITVANSMLAHDRPWHADPA